jgi:hypothetical protein
VTGLLQSIRRYERRRRFWRLVQVGGPDDCWPWLGTVDADGFGLFEGMRADTMAYRIARGRPAGAGRAVIHRCGDTRCVNPEHMTDAWPPDAAQEAGLRS